jgi:hypothetical protein
MQITFSVNWQKQLSRNLRLAVTKLPQMRDFFKEACQIVSDKSDDLFTAQWTNVQKNPKWKQLAASTIKARQKGWWYYKKRPNNPGVLRWTWNLQESKKISVNDKSWMLQFEAPYAIHHQEWGKNLPRRAVIDLDNSTNEKIVKAMQKKVQEDLWIFWFQV